MTAEVAGQMSPSCRRRCRIQEMLEQSRKKRQLLRERVDTHRQLRDITSGLVPGQKVYVRYEYDDIVEVADESVPPQIIDSRMIWWPAQLSIYHPQKHLRQASQATLTVEPRPTEVPAEPPRPASESAVPPSTSELITEEGQESDRQYTAEEVFNEIKEDLNPEDRENMSNLMKNHADKIVYTLDYEGRDAFGPESIPCFFMDEENLMHLHKCWGSAVYRTEHNIGDINLEERLEDGINAVANLFADEDGELICGFNESAERVVSLLKTMSAEDLYDYVSRLPGITFVLPTWKTSTDEEDIEDETDETDEADDANGDEDRCSVISSTLAGEKRAQPPHLEDKPFPRRI